jgi:hypothetical protein
MINSPRSSYTDRRLAPSSVNVTPTSPCWRPVTSSDSIEPPRNFEAVVIILESRLVTPMPERFKGKDGRTPVTGTEWEFEDALEGSLY